MEKEDNIILLTFTPEGLHCLKHDGWRYENCETHLKNVSNDIIRDVSVLHYGELQDRKFLGKCIIFKVWNSKTKYMIIFEKSII